MCSYAPEKRALIYFKHTSCHEISYAWFKVLPTRVLKMLHISRSKPRCSKKCGIQQLAMITIYGWYAHRVATISKFLLASPRQRVSVSIAVLPLGARSLYGGQIRNRGSANRRRWSISHVVPAQPIPVLASPRHPVLDERVWWKIDATRPWDLTFLASTSWQRYGVWLV